MFFLKKRKRIKQHILVDVVSCISISPKYFRIIYAHWCFHYHANETKSQEYAQDALTTHQQMNKAGKRGNLED